jgi:hypothetical protein
MNIQKSETTGLKMLFFLLLFIFYIPVAGASFHTGPVCTGISSWVVYPVDFEIFNAYNKLSFDAYFSYGKFKGFAGFPILYTISEKEYVQVNGIKVPGDTIVGKTAAGDFSAYIGFRIGSIEPRIGIVFPLGYATNTGVWLGSKNIILKSGLGFSGNQSKKLKLIFGGECYLNYYIAGFPQIAGSQGKRGSYSLEPDFKLSTERFKKLKFGIETLAGFKKFYPIWLKYNSFQGYELSSSVVPHIFASYDLSPRMYISGKCGFGPTFKRIVDSPSNQRHWHHTGYALNIGIGAGFYP